MNLDSKIHLLVLIIIVSYLAVAFLVVKDYGITFDEPENFAAGHKYLNYYLTGKLDLNDDTPVIDGHPNFYNFLFKDFPYRYGAVANILSAVSCYIFFQKFQILDPISAHHIIIPIMTGLFLYFFFRFVRNYWGIYSGAMSVLILVTFPRLFGDSFNNIKDVPQLIFSSIAVISCVNWHFYEKNRYLYLTFLFFGIALATKIDAVFIAVILILWLSACLIINHPWAKFFNKKMARNAMVGLLLVIGVFVFFYPPLFPWQRGKSLFISKMLSYGFQVGISKDTPWNIYPLSQVLYTTPILIFILFLIGLFYIFIPIFTTAVSRLLLKAGLDVANTKGALRLKSLARGSIHKDDKDIKMNLLLLIWLLFPVFRYCLAGSINSDGIRRFLIFIVPLSIIASIGAKRIFDRFSESIKLRRSFLALLLSAVVLIPNVYALISGHPFQNTYYNSLAGGLKGAQDKGIPFSCDYWLNSFRKAGEWLEKNAHNNATYDGFPYPEIIQYYIKRKDLTYISYDKLPSNCYFVLVPRKWWTTSLFQDISKYLLKVNKCQVAYQIKRQGGIIVTIYYNP